MAENNKKDSFNFPPEIRRLLVIYHHCRFHYRDSIFQYAFESGTDFVAEV